MTAQRSRKPPGARPAPARVTSGAAPPLRARRFDRTSVIAAALVIALACGAYANSLRNGFVWDDQIILSRQLVVFDSIGAILITPRDIPQYSPDYYRPVTVSSLLLDRALGGNDPFVFHLSVVLAHAAVSVLVLLLGWSLLPHDPVGFTAAIAGAALFAVHPIHTESVAWIAGRSDVLATLFLLAALVAHLRMGRGLWRATVVGVLALLALGAKETAIGLAPLLVLADLLIDRGERSRLWWPGYLGLGIAVVLYFALRSATVGGVVGSAVTGSPVDRTIIDMVGAVTVYLLKLVWPAGLNAYIDAVPTGMLALVTAVAASLALTALAFSAWRRGKGAVTYLLLWLALTLAPSLAIVWRIPEAPIAERYLYLPSVAFCLLAGYGAAILWRRAPSDSVRIVLAGAAALILAAAGAATWSRNRVWHDDLALWSDTVTKSEIAGLPMRSLGVAHLQRGESDDAQRYLELALQRRNSPAGLQVIYNNLGTIAMQAQRYDDARRYYEAALQSYSNAADTLFNLGLAILQGGGGTPDAAAAALPYFERAEQLSPHDADIQAALGQVAAIRSERERAIAYLRRALELGPAPAVAQNVRTFLAQLENRQR